MVLLVLVLVEVNRQVGDTDRLDSCDFRRLSTSSTVIVAASVGRGMRASNALGRNPTPTALFPLDEDKEEGGSNVLVVVLVLLEVVESRLALRRRLAPFVNFSCQVDPFSRHSSVMRIQSGQQARRGTVWSSGRRW